MKAFIYLIVIKYDLIYTNKDTFKYKINKIDKQILIQLVKYYNALNSI